MPPTSHWIVALCIYLILHFVVFGYGHQVADRISRMHGKRATLKGACLMPVLVIVMCTCAIACMFTIVSFVTFRPNRPPVKPLYFLNPEREREFYENMNPTRRRYYGRDSVREQSAGN